MKMKKSGKARMDFDFQNDSLYVRPAERKYRSSMQEDKNFIIDLDENGKIDGIEILNISKILRVPKTFLKYLSSGAVKIESSKDIIRIEIYLSCLVRNKEKATTLIMREGNPDPECIKPGQLNLAMA
jgi:uncharacterized protein YuzE